MRKVRLLVVIIALALMAMGIGYAVWNQSLPINLTGSLARLNVDAASAVVVIPADLDDAAADALRSITTASITNNKDVSLVANKLAPGQSREYTVTYTNTGDIPAVLTTLGVARVSNGAALDQITVTVDGHTKTLTTSGSITLDEDLPVGQSVSLAIKIALASDAPDDLNDLENRQFALKLTPVFTQK